MLAILIALAWQSAAFGQASASEPRGPSIEGNLHAGVIKFDDSVLGGEARPLFGARLVYRLPGGTSYGANLDVTGREGVDVVLYSGEVGHTFNRSGRVRWFLSGGLGVASFEGGSDIESSQTHMLVPATVGLRVVDRALGPRFGLRMDVRANLIGGDSRFVDGPTLHWEVSAGISLFAGTE